MGEELQRARIVRAIAEEMATREDPHAVSVADVLARAGVSRRAFYELYRDREECLLDAFEWGLQLAGAEMYAAYSRESRWQDGVREALGALLGLLDREPALARLCIVHALGAGAPVLQRRTEALEALCEYVDRGRLESACRTEPPEMAAEGVVGAVLAVIHTRLLAAGGRPASGSARAAGSPMVSGAQPLSTRLSELQGPLMSLILLPYMGAAKAGRELNRPSRRAAPGQGATAQDGPADELQDDFDMRLTYRTARVLQAIGERPGASNREVADQAGVVDQGQISRLLGRLEGLGLIANRGGAAGGASSRGAANAWVLTPRGERLERGVSPRHSSA